jgi:hypothetical protein
MDPPQRPGVIGPARRTPRERANRSRQNATDGCVAVVQLLRRSDCLVDCTEHQGKDDVESSMEGAYRSAKLRERPLIAVATISAETALRLGRYFSTDAAFWINLQAQYDLAVVEREFGAQIAMRSTRMLRSTDPCARSAASHQSLGSAAFIASTSAWHNRWVHRDNRLLRMRCGRQTTREAQFVPC